MICCYFFTSTLHLPHWLQATSHILAFHIIFVVRVALSGVSLAEKSGFFWPFFYKIKNKNFSYGYEVRQIFVQKHIWWGNYQKKNFTRHACTSACRNSEKLVILIFEICDFAKLQIIISGRLIYAFCCGRNMMQPYAGVIGHINQIGQIGLDGWKSIWKHGK